MAKKKLEIKATEEQLNKLYNSLMAGTPIMLALTYSGISQATYYYWVAIYSIVVAVKTQEEIEEIEQLANSGVSIQQVRDMASAALNNKKSAVGTFIEPSQESILQYKNNRKFHNFADKVFEIVKKCNETRSGFAVLQLNTIRKSTSDKKINPSGAMWFLERNFSDFFAKPGDKAKDQETEKRYVEPVQVEFIDPETPDTQQRLLDMEQEILNGIKGKGDA